MEGSKGEKAAEIKAARWKEIPGWLLVNCIKSDDELRQVEIMHDIAVGFKPHVIFLGGWSWCQSGHWKVTRLATAQIVGFKAEEENVVGLLWFGVAKGVAEQKRKPIEHYFFRVP